MKYLLIALLFFPAVALAWDDGNDRLLPSVFGREHDRRMEEQQEEYDRQKANERLEELVKEQRRTNEILEEQQDQRDLQRWLDKSERERCRKYGDC